MKNLPSFQINPKVLDSNLLNEKIWLKDKFLLKIISKIQQHDIYLNYHWARDWLGWNYFNLIQIIDV